MFTISFISALSIILFLNEWFIQFTQPLLKYGLILFSLYCLVTYYADNVFSPAKKDICLILENQVAIKKLLTKNDKVISSAPLFGLPLVTETRSVHYGSYNGYNKKDDALLNDLKKYRITAILMPDTASYIPSFFSRFQKISLPLKGIFLYKIDSSVLTETRN